MGARTGSQFLAGLKRPRDIWLGSEKVTDVAAHPAFAGAARTVAQLFDLQHQAADVCLMPDEQTGEPINVSHLIPRSREDLHRRHLCLQRIAEFTAGMMGRSPDYMNVTFAGFAGRADEWSEGGNEEGAANLVAYQKYIARQDLALTHSVIPITIDRKKDGVPRLDSSVALRKVADTEHGIVVRGARVLASLAPFADEIAVYRLGPELPEGLEPLALAFSIPVGTPGVKFLCRDSLSSAASLFDAPLSSRFDEQDAFVIFDDVEVPRDRVFIDGSRAAYNAATRTSWSANIMQQTMIRAQTKLEFAYGLASRMAEAINDTEAVTQQALGEIWMYAEFARSAVLAAEAEAYEYGNGVWLPKEGPLAALRAALPQWLPRVKEIITLLGSSKLFAAPSEGMFGDASLQRLLPWYLCGAMDLRAEERSRIYRLAWDFVGSGLAGRNALYERFYLGSPAVCYQMAHIQAPKQRARGLVQHILGMTP